LNGLRPKDLYACHFGHVYGICQPGLGRQSWRNLPFTIVLWNIASNSFLPEHAKWFP